MRVKSFDSTRVFCWRPSNLEVSNHMECKILLLFFGWILLLLLSVCVNVGNVSALDDNNSIDCYWSGEGPICDGKCRPGETVASHKNDGNGCIIGKKKYCCKTGTAESDSSAQKPQQQQLDQITTTEATTSSTKDDCYWVGKSPTCVGSCLQGDYTAITSRTGNGSTCIVGKKKYCCKGNIPNNNKTTLINKFNASATTQRTDESMKQMTNSSCYWVGNAPICLGSCKFAGDYVAKKSPTGDGGSKCESGQKKLCCQRGQQLSTTTVSTTTEESGSLKTTTVGDNSQNGTQLNSIFTHRPFFIRTTVRDNNGENDTNNEMNFISTHRPFHQTTVSTDDNNNIGQNESVTVEFLENSFSNSTTHRPFHSRRRPTSNGQPNNSTVNNHLKIVKIKRKLVMSTPTNDLTNMLTSTSIPLPSSFTTTTTSLSVLPSSESTTLLPFHHFHPTVDSVTSIPTTTSTTTPSTPVSTTSSTMIPMTFDATTPVSSTSDATSSTPFPTTSTTSTSIPATPIPTTSIPATTSSAASSTFIETESTSVATVASTSLPLPPPASTIMQTTTSIPTTTTTTMAMKMLTKPFFNLPDVLPVPLIFRLLLRPTIEQFTNNKDVNATSSTLDAATSIIQSSTTSAATETTTTTSSNSSSSSS
uniref:Uncharacterized protein n=1 Tax=Daphnia galeata TaxID=27404 RepID=A0A8J2RZK5_9CRUS|nr:unnamed protein product [Daphnia galeata]